MPAFQMSTDIAFNSKSSANLTHLDNAGVGICKTLEISGNKPMKDIPAWTFDEEKGELKDVKGVLELVAWTEVGKAIQVVLWSHKEIMAPLVLMANGGALEALKVQFKPKAWATSCKDDDFGKMIDWIEDDETFEGTLSTEPEHRPQDYGPKKVGGSGSGGIPIHGIGFWITPARKHTIKSNFTRTTAKEPFYWGASSKT